MSYTSDKTAYNAAINTAITTQTAPNTIPPEEVGGGMTDLADMLEPYINAINNQALLFGPGIPSNSLGVDLDLYFRQGNPIIIYRKLAGSWVEQGQLPLDFTLPDGNLTVQTSINGMIVSASYGGWVIAGTVYSKSTQTQLTLDAANTNYYRYDNIYATTSGTILYQVGTASVSPVAPTLPADTILIDVAIVPSVVSAFVPYLQSGGNSNDFVHRSGPEIIGGNKLFTDPIYLDTFDNYVQADEIRLTTAGAYPLTEVTPTKLRNLASATLTSSLRDGGAAFTIGSVTGNLKPSVLTGATKNWILPDASGTLALLSDISTPSNSITNDTALQAGADFNIDGNGQASSFITTGDGFKFAGTNEGQIINDTLTADRIWKLPNASGTVAVVGLGNVTNATDGAMKIKRGTASDTDSILEGLNGAGTTTFSVKGNGSLGVMNSSPLAPIHVGGRNVNNSTDAQVLISRTINTGTGNAHAFSDSSDFSRSGGVAYCSYDARVNITGVNSYDHYVGFQSGQTLNFTGTLLNNYGLFTTSLLQAGSITNNYGAYIANPSVTGGAITNNYGIYIENQTSGGVGNNYAIFSNGGANYLKGNTVIDGFIEANSVGQNIRLKGGGTGPTDGGLFVNGSGNLFLSNWDGTRGFVTLGSGIGYYFGGNFGVGTATANEQLTVNERASFNATTAASATSGQAKLWSQTVSGTTDLYAINSAGTSGKIMIGTLLNGSTSYSPSLVAGASAFVTFTVTGASIGDFVMGSFSLSLGNVMLSAHVSATDTVTVVLYNPSGVTQTLGSGTLRARILKV